MAGHSETLNTFGKRVRAARRAKGIKMITCAREIGLSRTGLYGWESDAVTTPDTLKLIAFTKLTDVSLDWLVEGVGPVPSELSMQAPRRKSSSHAAASNGDHLFENAGGGVDIPEIDPSLTRHARAIDMKARALWSIPSTALEMGFNANVGNVVIKRVITREGSDFGVARGDYVLIDASRTRMDEPGIYLLADPEGKSAKRARVEWFQDRLRIMVLADDVGCTDAALEADHPVTVLGRIMGVFRPV